MLGLASRANSECLLHPAFRSCLLKPLLPRQSDETLQKVLPLQECVEQAVEIQLFQGSFK